MNPDDQELRAALALLADDSDPAADIAATVRTRLRGRDRLRRTVAVGSLAAAVVATITVASALAPTRPTTSVLPVAASVSPTPRASSAASSAADSSSTEAPASPTPPEEVVDQVSFRCLATADVSDRNYVSITAMRAPDTGAQALSSCTRLWAEGTLSTTAPYVVDQPTNPAEAVVPALVACLLPLTESDYVAGSPRQEIAVLPGGPELCGQLGLGVPDN